VLTEILEDRSRIPEPALDDSTFPRQASWDEWGRGYARGARGESSNLLGVPAPDRVILEVPSRDAAVNVLNEIGEQGESPIPLSGDDATDADEHSHYVRFLTIYRALNNECAPQHRFAKASRRQIMQRRQRS
jgi:hypothetical protein